MSSDLVTVVVLADFDKPQQFKDFGIRKFSDGELHIVGLEEDGVTEPAAAVGTSLDGLCHFLQSDNTIVKTNIIGKQGDSGPHDTSEIHQIANKVLKAIASNAFLKATVVTLEGLDVTNVCQNLVFPENSFFTLGLRDMKAPADAAALQETLKLLTPERLGLRLYQTTTNELIQALATSMQRNDCFQMLILEQMDAVTASAVAQLLNQCPSLESVGFPTGSFDVDIASALQSALKPGRFTGRFIVNRCSFDVTLATKLDDLIREKLTAIKALNLSYNQFTNEAFGTICLGLKDHATLKTFSAVHCTLEGDRTDALKEGIATLFHSNKVLETIKLDHTGLLACDAPTWAPLAENKTLKQLSLKKCFEDPASWMQLYEGLSGKAELEMGWIFDLKSSGLAIKFSPIGTIELTPGMTITDYAFIRTLVKGTPSVERHVLIISPEAALGSTLQPVLGEVITCEKVERIEFKLPNRSDAMELMTNYMSSVVDPENKALTLLQDVLPRANPAFREVRFGWPGQVNEEDEERQVPVEITIRMGVVPCKETIASKKVKEAKSRDSLPKKESLTKKQKASIVHQWKCLCGKFTAQVTGSPNLSYLCHCSRCRRFNGNVGTPLAQYNSIQIRRGVDNLIKYMIDEEDGGRMARYSCATCGSYCFGASPDKSILFVPMGALQPMMENADAKTIDQAILEPDANVYCGFLEGHFLKARDLPKFYKMPDQGEDE